MPTSKHLSDAATTLHGIAANAGIALGAAPWPAEIEAQAEILAGMVADVAEGLAAQRAQAAESPGAKLAAQVAAMEPVIIRMCSDLNVGTPWPREQPVESLRAGLHALEQQQKHIVAVSDELLRENIKLKKCATRAFVDEAHARTLAARALYEAAETRVQVADLDEKLAIAVDRGHLPATFRTDLIEWTK